MKRVLWIALIGMAACKQPDAAPAQPKPEVELVSPGAEPRKTLRYHLAKGAVNDAVFALDMDLVAGPRDVKMPTLELTVAIRVEDVARDGTASLRFTFEDAQGKDREGASVPVRQVTEQAQLLVGAAMTGKLSPTGKLADVALVTTPKLTAALGDQIKELTQSVEQVAMPLPDQPVGVGAVWKTRKPIKQNGMQIVMTTTVSLASLQGDSLGFTTKATVEGADQTVSQNGVSMQITGLGGGGDGKGTIDLAKLALAAQLSAEFKATMRALGETAPMDVKMVMRVAPQGAHSAP